MERKYNVGIVIEIFYPEINGIITTTMNIADNLKKQGHHPFILTPRVQGSPKEVKGIKVYHVPSVPIFLYPGLCLPAVGAKKFIQSILQKEQCSIIHSTAPWNTCKLVTDIAHSLSIPSIQTIHTNLHSNEYLRYIYPFAGKNKKIDIRLQKWAAQYLINKYAKYEKTLTCPSISMTKFFQNCFPKKNIIHVSNGVDLSLFTQHNKTLIEEIAPPLKDTSRKYALFIGRIATEKAIDILLKAVSILQKKLPTFLLVLIGDGPLRQKYQRKSYTLNIINNIYFAGKHSHEKVLKSGIIKNARCFVTASTSEVQSMTVIEAICSETPLVLANHLSMRTFTGNAPLYANPKSPQDFASALYHIMTDNTLYAEKVSAILPLKKELDGEQNTKKFLEIYETCIKHSQYNKKQV